MRPWLICVVWLCSQLGALAQETPGSEVTRPNVLFLFADDQRADAVGAWGNPYIETPHIDSLVREGFSWRETHVMGGHHGAICAPSRAMLLSGRQLFRVYDNLDGVPTFPAQLGAEGYATFGTGKWHQSRKAFAESFQQGRHIFFGGMANHFETRVHNLAADGSYVEAERGGRFSTTLFADAAIEFLNERAEAQATTEQQPFLAYVSFTAPHDPRTPPAEFAERYRGEELPLPPNFRNLHTLNLGPQCMTVRDEKLAAWPRDPGTIRDQLAEYYGLITHMDHEIGRILAALEKNGQSENTIVVFAADNGLALGSHGLLGKQSVYEHSTRVPFVLKGPGIPTGSSNALVYLFDIGPTLLTLLGASALPEIDGQDLSAVLAGEQDKVRDELYTVYRDSQRAIRSGPNGSLKLVRYPRLHMTRLYDLERDPYELHDLFEHPDYAGARESLELALASWHEELADPHPLLSEKRDSLRFDPSGVERKPDRWQPASIVEKYFDQ